MPISHTQGTVQWSAANNVTLTSAAVVVSDAVAMAATCPSLSISLSADNQGSPGSGDTAVFRIRWSTDGGTTYDSEEHADYLRTLDTYATNTPGEDPARGTVIIDRKGSHFKIAVSSANAATRNMLIAATYEQEIVS